jgi:hypothetical protein
MKQKLSLAELMGRNAATKGESGKLCLDDLHEILGESMPELPRTAVGRHRLVRALQQRFGANFRNLPGVGDLIKDFDAELGFEKKIAQMRAIRLRGK